MHTTRVLSFRSTIASRGSDGASRRRSGKPISHHSHIINTPCNDTDLRNSRTTDSVASKLSQLSCRLVFKCQMFPTDPTSSYIAYIPPHPTPHTPPHTSHPIHPTPYIPPRIYISCRRSADRQACHAQVNDTIHRALVKAGVPSTREPVGDVGLMLSGDQRPDGCTLVSWERGKCLYWDATIPDTLAQSHLSDTSIVAGAAAERAAKIKRDKYTKSSLALSSAPSRSRHWAPINEEGARFLTNLGHRL